MIVASKHARKPGFACITLLCRDLGLVFIDQRFEILVHDNVSIVAERVSRRFSAEENFRTVGRAVDDP